jgi:hypothetical protein
MQQRGLNFDMKTRRTLLILALLADMTNVALAQSTNVTATATASGSQIQRMIPVLQLKSDFKKDALKNQDKISRYQGCSSQAWTTIATKRPDTSLFHDCKSSKPEFCLLTLTW